MRETSTSVASAVPLDLDALANSEQVLWHASEAELLSGIQFLSDKPEETARSTLAALWHTAAGTPYSVERAISVAPRALNDEAKSNLKTLLRKRIDGIPLAHLTQRQHFMGLELLASEAALIPRRETELLGNAALERLNAILVRQESATVIDVCTGSGNLALALAAHAPRARVWAADLDESAVAFARTNAAHVGLADRVTFSSGDLIAPFDHAEFHGKVDLLVCNPPYISTGKVETMPDEIIGHEPRLAFDGGPLGIKILQRLIAEAPRLLRDGGYLAFEVGAGQGRGIRRRLEQQSAFTDIDDILDHTGQARALVARWVTEVRTA
jgi:release factor glutamine methyltransferase